MLRVVSHCNLNGFDILEGGFWISFYQVYGLSWMCWHMPITAAFGLLTLKA